MIQVLFSSGIDSLACLIWALSNYGRDTVQPVYLQFGQSYADFEVTQARYLCNRFDCLPLRVESLGFNLKENSDGLIPLRNIFLLLHCARNEQNNGVVFGMLHGESPEDKNPKFVADMQHLLDSQFQSNLYRSNKHTFDILTPFERDTKTGVVKYIKDMGYGNLITHTIGCLNVSRGGSHCGRCISCFNRWVALRNNSIPSDYYIEDNHPFDWMMSNVICLNKLKKQNSKLFSLSKVPKKMLWFLESFQAMSSYSQLFLHKNIFEVYQQRKKACQSMSR